MKYFTIKELEHSNIAEKAGIKNTMDKHARRNYEAFTDKVLDVLRERWGSPIVVSSGYRCADLNRMVGGVYDSYHLGKDDKAAVDLVQKDGSIDELYRLLKEMVRLNEVVVDKVLFEHSGASRWLHVQYRRVGVNRGILVDRYNA